LNADLKLKQARCFRRPEATSTMAWIMVPNSFQLVLILLLILEVSCYSVDTKRHHHESTPLTRRHCLIRSLYATSLVISTTWGPEIAVAIPAKSNPLKNLVEARDTLDILLTNYKRATIDCTYADVPRELLESKNKELLLEKASTFALFDKSVSVESCKTTNRIVRDYLGVTGKGTVGFFQIHPHSWSLCSDPYVLVLLPCWIIGPLVGIEKQIKNGLDYIDSDDLEDYLLGELLIQFV
jgi:hypothetical protein